MDLATYRRGPHFLVGESTVPLTVRDGALCVDTGPYGVRVLLVLRRRLVDTAGGEVRYDGQLLVPGSTARLASVASGHGFTDVQLPPGFDATTSCAYVV